jgi:hypothetical protein
MFVAKRIKREPTVQGSRDQEGADSALQPSREWGCREEEQVHHIGNEGYDS